jgi:hypothetical protein
MSINVGIFGNPGVGNSQRERLEALLSYDPIADTERQTGKGHWSEFNQEDQHLAILNTMMSGTCKREILQQLGDTYFGLRYQEFIDLIVSNGFKKALEYDFDSDAGYCNHPTDRFACYYREDGLVIVFDSYGDSLNGGQIYGNYKLKEGTTDRLCDGSSSPMGNGIIGFSKDIREGMFHFISKVKNVGDILPIWKGSGCFSWMLDRSERRSNDSEPYESWSKRYRVLTIDMIRRCPEDFQKIVNVYIDGAVNKGGI